MPDFDLESVAEELQNHIRLTREEEGCLVFEVSQDNADLNRFYVYEEFTNQDTFELHQQRVKDSKLGNISSNVERHYKISSIE